MQQITDLEQRITAALERIGHGVDRIVLSGQRHAAPQAAKPAAQPAATITEAALQAQLDAEKAVTAQLQGRLRAQRDGDNSAGGHDKIDRLTQQLDVQGLELQRMRRTVTSLRDQLQALRLAHISGQAEPQLINKAMAAELEALRATRLTEMAEMDEILAALEPHLAEAGHA